MLKIVGSVIVIICATGIGFATANDYRKRIEELSNIKKIMIMLKGEIKYAKAPLAEAFENIGERMSQPYKKFLLKISDRLYGLGGGTFYNIWADEIDAQLTELNLYKSDLKQLKQVGQSMGYLDNDMQQRNIDLYIEQLEHEVTKSEQQAGAKMRVFQCLGIMSGLFVVIMLI